MSTDLLPAAPPRGTVRDGGGRATARRFLDLPEVRWAGAALAGFAVALPLQLLGAPAWAWGTLYALVYAAGGWEPGLAGLRALRERTLDVDLLMVLAALGAASIGQVMDGALLIVIFATSGALEAVATARTADSVRGLLDLAPATAVRRTGDGGEETVPAGRLRAGDTIVVRPGERIGGDGRVLAGTSEVDQATITGEPLPAAKGPGDEVFAGTLNGTGALTVRVGRDPADSVLARIVTMVEEASRTKAPTQLFIEKVERRYSLGMVAATVALLAVPMAFGAALEPTLLRAMTFMIVASPCAIVLATMPPLLSAIACAGRHGVLVKSAVVMERLAQVDTVAMDKTGTLTEGAPEVVDVRPLDGAGLGADELLRLAAGAEHPSEHPLARAITAAARARGLIVPDAAGFASAPGVGVTATVDGRAVAVGAPGRLLDGDRPAAAVRLEDAGRTAVLVAVDGVPAGVLGVADRPRAGARSAVAALDRLTGAPPVLLTGDGPRAAARTAAEVGVADVRAGLLPQDKVAAVRELEAGGRRVLLVGDGVNDAPALAAAHVGAAMGRAGSDLALETADVVVVRDELPAVPAVVALARRARRLVAQNLLIAGTFITVLVVWDLAWTLPLPLGVAGHEGSTVLVGLNGLRLLTDRAWRRAATA
ncbi:heavy metal translocating P-type ATPase [Actinomadura algeriensis]|uniref:Heavy metal translocating P-type ATPase n=1 Tax=Actinomadura algeriensis TaxID=1679523 RepID=A0ABR9JTW2_9ACTN|nr:heavy metal translocating P-type ATPase [Actinomadura algeriensis]MBE1534004.1 heavy metal translocating P-type ATPase [Actinomadura algeriensis]